MYLVYGGFRLGNKRFIEGRTRRANPPESNQYRASAGGSSQEAHRDKSEINKQHAPLVMRRALDSDPMRAFFAFGVTLAKFREQTFPPQGTRQPYPWY